MIKKIRYKIDRGWWWTRGILWDRFNIVKCKSLPPTWNDRDQVLLHAAFQCLTDFIDKEKPWEFDASSKTIYAEYNTEVDGKAMPGMDQIVKDWKTIKRLYRWWNQRKHDYDSNPADNSMLHELINIRGYMWT